MTHDTFQLGDPDPSRGPIVGIAQMDLDALRAERDGYLSKYQTARKVAAKAYSRAAHVYSCFVDEGDRVYLESTNDADILRDLSREWDEHRIMGEELMTVEDELSIAKAERDALAGQVAALREILLRAPIESPSGDWARGYNRALTNTAAAAASHDARIRVAALALPEVRALVEACGRLPSGEWETWTSNSYRRITAKRGPDGGVLHAYTQRSDGHPDLSWTEDECRAICEIVNGLRALSAIKDRPHD